MTLTEGKFTRQKLEKLETWKLENDFRVCEVHKTRIKNGNCEVHDEVHDEFEILNIIIIQK